MLYQSQMPTSVNLGAESSDLMAPPPPVSSQMDACTLGLAPDQHTAVDQSAEAIGQSDGRSDEQSVAANICDISNPPNTSELDSSHDKPAGDASENKENTDASPTATNDTTNCAANAEEAAVEPPDADTPDASDSKKDEEIDLDQCRICMSPSNLLDIFRIGEKTSFRICDLIMKLAPAVKISERDYLPHSVCSTCVERIEAAYELRLQCEETDTLLRSKLKRSKKTRRAPAEFVLIDAAESSTDSDDDQKSDDEFKISEDSEESSDSYSDSSYDEKKKRPTQRIVKRPVQTNKRQPYQAPPAKKARKSGVVYIKAENSDDDEEYGAKKKVTVAKKPAPPRFAFRCDVCNRTCTSAEALSQHRRTHPDEKCTICSAVFKQRSALTQHMQMHKNDPERNCQKCHKTFATKFECQRHIKTAHAEMTACNRCKRYFPSKSQFDAHKCASNDRKSTETSIKRKSDNDSSASGRDLFKSVAPLTTTYWSDSFSD